MELKCLLVEAAVLQTGVVGCGGLDVAPAVPYPSLGTSVSCIHSTPLSQGSGGQSFLQQRLQQDVGEEWVNTSPPLYQVLLVAYFSYRTKPFLICDSV